MKKWFISLCLMYLLLLVNCSQKKIAEIHFINLYTTTIIAVKCEDLKKSTHLKNLTLDSDETENLLKLFKNLKPASSNYKVDARLFGVAKNGSEKTEFCMSAGVIDLNGKRYFVNDELRNFILKLSDT